MAKKMYYSEAEAAAKLGGPSGLEKFVRDGKLRAFQDGAKKMYKVDDVDPLAGGEAEIELTPVDSSAGDVVSLADTAEQKPPAKEDTVITSEGISIFDDEDLEIEEADPMAKTHVAAPLEDQLSSDSVGSGSGLLDLTRESDDTSLGAEILDHIDMEGAIGSSIAAAVATEPEPFAGGAPGAPVAGPTVVEQIDPMAGLFGGLILGACVAMVLVALAIPAAIFGVVPGFLEGFQQNMPMLLAGVIAIVAVAGSIGYFTGKMNATRRAALLRQASM